MLLADTAVNGARHSTTDSNVSTFLVPTNVENRDPTSCLLTARIRCMHCFHCLSGQYC